MLLPVAAAHATVFEGAEVVKAVSGSVEVNESLEQVLQAQTRYDRHLSYFGTTIRWAPGKFELSDGQQVAGNLARYLVGAGVGVGRPSKVGAHFGLAMDGIGETGAPGFGYGGYQEILYFGMGVKGFQVTLNGRVDFLGGGVNNLDPWLQFQSKEADQSLVYPQPVPFDKSLGNTHGTTWSLYHGQTGAYGYITYSGSTIYDLRAHFQPLAQLLPPLFGLPAAGLRWIDDRALEAFPQAPEGTTPTGFEALQPPEKRFQSDLGTDDALNIGMRTRVVVEWSPVPVFRYAEIGMVKAIGELEAPIGFGFRGAVAVPEDRPRVAFESFGMLGMGETDGGAPIGHVAASYSYSVPDGTTYIPIPDAHVFGVQLVFGAAETSKPIVPLVRGLDAK